MTEIEIFVNMEEVDTAAQLRDSLSIGDRLYYPEASRDADIHPSRKRKIPCRVVGKYPHLVEVSVGTSDALPIRTISYAEMLSDPGLMRRRG